MMWKSEREVMIVFPDISAMLVSEGIRYRKAKVADCDLIS